jgi:hypothetical protein
VEARAERVEVMFVDGTLYIVDDGQRWKAPSPAGERGGRVRV